MISVIKCWCVSLIDQESSFGKGVKNRRHDEWCLYLLFKLLKKELHFNLSLMCSSWLDEFQGNEMHKLHWVIPELTYVTPLSGSRFYKLCNSFFPQADASWALAAPQPPSRPPWNDYKFRPIVHISSFAYCLKIALSLCKRNETNILHCCCEQFTIPSSYSVFLCILYTCLHRGPGVSNKVNSFSESVIFMFMFSGPHWRQLKKNTECIW